MKEQVVDVTRREAAGKNAARRLRRAGSIPAVLYGAGKEPVSLTVDPRRLTEILRSEAGVKKRGRRRVILQIEAAGIASSIARRVVDETFSTIDDDKLLNEALDRRLRGAARIEDERQFHRLYRQLVAQGFDADRVLALLRARTAKTDAGLQ